MVWQGFPGFPGFPGFARPVNPATTQAEFSPCFLGLSGKKWEKVVRLGAGLTQTPQTRPETGLGGTPVSPAASGLGAIYKSMQTDLQFQIDKYTYLIPGQGETTLPEVSRILESVPPIRPHGVWQIAYLSGQMQRILQQLYSLGVLDRDFITRPLAYPGITKEWEMGKVLRAHGVYPPDAVPPVGQTPSKDLRYPFVMITESTPLSVILETYTPDWMW